MRKRIGMLGGTFNPIHLGHLEMAAQTQAALAPDEMILMPDTKRRRGRRPQTGCA